MSTDKIGIVMFADDMVMMAETEKALEHKMQVMNGALHRWDLRVNWKKSKVMSVARKREECQVLIGDERLEQVDTMKYLGATISSDGSMQREVKARLGCASSVIVGMSQAILRRRELSRQMKLKVVNVTVMLVLTYRCEAWVVIGVLETVKKRQEEWKGRVEAMDKKRFTRRVFEGVVEGRRPRGRSQLQWMDNFR